MSTTMSATQNLASIMPMLEASLGTSTQPQSLPDFNKALEKLILNLVRELLANEDEEQDDSGEQQPGPPVAHGPAAPLGAPPAPLAKADAAAAPPVAPPPLDPAAVPPADPPPPGFSKVPNWVGPKPDGKETPPAGKSAEDIIKANKCLANLDPREKEAIKKQFPNYQTDPTQAYQASRALDYVNSSLNYKGGVRDDKVTNSGRLEGYSSHHEAFHGTPAGDFQDFCRDGYPALKDNHQLDKPTDDHVRLDGTPRSNEFVNIEHIANALPFIPSAMIVKSILKTDHDHAPNVGEMIVGGIKGYGKLLKAEAKGFIDGLEKGRINPVSMAMSVEQSIIESNLQDTKDTAAERDAP